MLAVVMGKGEGAAIPTPQNSTTTLSHSFRVRSVTD